jgi:hypothetical protein
LFAWPKLFARQAKVGCKEGPGPNALAVPFGSKAPSYDPKYDLLSGPVQRVERGTAPQSEIATKYLGDAAQSGIVTQRRSALSAISALQWDRRSKCRFKLQVQRDGNDDFNLKPAPSMDRGRRPGDHKTIRIRGGAHREPRVRLQTEPHHRFSVRLIPTERTASLYSLATRLLGDL